MSYPLLLDEMFTPVIARRWGERGHDVAAVVTDQALLRLSDDQILAAAASDGRALVIANIKDFAPLDAAYQATGRSHAGLVLVSTKTFPQDQSFIDAVVAALTTLLAEPDLLGPDQMLFLRR